MMLELITTIYVMRDYLIGKKSKKDLYELNRKKIHNIFLSGKKSLKTIFPINLSF